MTSDDAQIMTSDDLVLAQWRVSQRLSRLAHVRRHGLRTRGFGHSLVVHIRQRRKELLIRKEHRPCLGSAQHGQLALTMALSRGPHDGVTVACKLGHRGGDALGTTVGAQLGGVVTDLRSNDM